jgi:hypothetical protein
VYSQCETLLVEAVADGTRALGSTEALVDGASGPHGSAVDAPVEEEHHEHGQIEGAQRRVHHVSSVVRELTDPGTPYRRYLHSNGTL